MSFKKRKDPDSLRDDMKWRIVGIAGKRVIDAIMATCRIDRFDPYGSRDLVEMRRCIVVFWHSRIMGVAYTHQGYDGVIMVSRHQDGEIIAQTIYRQGHLPIRGSTRKGGGKALNRMVELLKTGPGIGVVIPDGPQGPRYRAQPGAIELARRTGLPIVPLSYSARDITVFKSWDRFILPHPGTKVSVVYGRPIRVANDTAGGAHLAKQKELEEEMNRITRNVDKIYGHHLVDA